MAYVLISCRILLLVVFAAAALGKLGTRRAWTSFLQSVRDLRLVPDRATRAVAAAVVGGEVATVGLVLVPATVPAALALAAALLTVFTVAILLTLRAGRRAPCQCFGAASLPLSRRHVVRNGLLLVVVLLGALGLASTRGPAHPAGLAVAAAVGLVGGALLVFFDEIVELFVGPTSSVRPSERRSL